MIYLYDGVNSDSGLRPDLPDLPFLPNYKLNNEDLYETLNELKTVKDQIEIELLQFISRISSEAHIRVMRNTKPGLIEG